MVPGVYGLDFELMRAYVVEQPGGALLADTGLAGSGLAVLEALANSAWPAESSPAAVRGRVLQAWRATRWLGRRAPARLRLSGASDGRGGRAGRPGSHSAGAGAG